jgi:tetratricopeptide (TPR) repeat protein
MQKLRVRAIPSMFLLAAPFVSLAQDVGSPEQPASEKLVWEHVQTLETMISMWPEQEYYLQLASLYGRVGKYERQLELYEVANAMGWLTQTRQFVRLARLLLRAGRLDEVDDALQKALKAELTEPTLADDD